MDKKKRQQFSLKEKREILLEVEKGGIAKKYGISPSTLPTFLKQKSKIEQNIDADILGPQRKKQTTRRWTKPFIRGLLKCGPKTFL